MYIENEENLTSRSLEDRMPLLEREELEREI